MTTIAANETDLIDHAAAGARHAEQLRRHAGQPEASETYPWRRFRQELRNACDWLSAMTRPGHADPDGAARRARLALNAAHGVIDRQDAYGEGSVQQRTAYDAVAEVRADLMRRYGPII